VFGHKFTHILTNLFLRLFNGEPMTFIKTLVFMTLIPLSLNAQIKINNPYQKKDQTYIPDGDSEDPAKPKQEGDLADAEEAVRNVVLGLMQAMHESDGNAVRQFFSDNGRLLHTEATGKVTVWTVEGFSKMISESVKGSMEEKITSIDISIDDHLASVWAGYEFYLNNTLHHCGVDAIQLIRTPAGWKILQIAGTSREDCSASGLEAGIHKILDDWHAAAARADAGSYFERLSTDGFYLGTDPAENWDKASFYRFSKPYFDKGNAWKFTPRDRKVYFSDDQQVAWFNELLDTWMGTCRGSGVLRLEPDGTWRIMQYNLAILVPNELVQDYLKLLKDK
jgi:hypothetical protein